MVGGLGDGDRRSRRAGDVVWPCVVGSGRGLGEVCELGSAAGEGQGRFQRSCQSMSLEVMISVIARASCASRWMLLRSVLRRSWPWSESHELVRSTVQRSPGSRVGQFEERAWLGVRPAAEQAGIGELGSYGSGSLCSTSVSSALGLSAGQATLWCGCCPSCCASPR